MAWNALLFVTGRSRYDRYIYDDSFDREFGTDTAGVVELDEMELGEELTTEAVRYEATEPAGFHFLLDRVGLPDIHHYTFIDLGSGKGRVLILAALAGFRRIIGIELDPALHAIANRNIEKVRVRCSSAEFETLNQNATTFQFPAVPILCFMNNPFRAEALLQVVQNLEISLREHPRDCVLVYLHAFHADILRARPDWEHIDHGEFKTERTPFAIFRWRPSNFPPLP